jgi:hypothetical protein
MFYLAGEALAASVLLKCMLKPPQLILYLLFQQVLSVWLSTRGHASTN